MTTAADPPIVPRPPATAPALRAADEGVANALESVLSDNTRRVYGAQWRLFNDWCAEMGLRARFDLALVAVLSDGGCGAVSLC